MAKIVALKRLLQMLKRLIGIFIRRVPSKRVFSLDSILRRDFLVVFLILILAASSQIFSGSASSHTVSGLAPASHPLPTTIWQRSPTGSAVSISPALPDQVEKPNENIAPTPTPPTYSVSPSPDALPFPSPLPTPTSSPSMTIITLGLYGNNPFNNQSAILLDIDWSSLTPGEEQNSSVIYFRNEGDLPFTMSFSIDNWVFLDSSNNDLSQNYSSSFALSWNYNNSPLAVNEVRPVVFTLAVSSDIKDVVDFSFDIVITITSSN